MSLPAGTFINRGRQLYASVSQSAENWYTFPAANGQIIMQDASGSQILEAIGTDQFYDGQLLAKSSDLQDIAAWSDYPVVNPAGVDFNGNPLKNATNIDATGTVTAGGALTVTGDISGSGNLTVPNAEITATSLTVSNGINTLSSSISTSGLSTNATIPAANQIRHQKLAKTEVVP